MIFGIHAVSSWLQSGQATPQDHLLIDAQRRDGRLKKLLAQAEKAHIPVQKIFRKELDQKANGAVHQGVLVEQATQSAQASRNHSHQNSSDHSGHSDHADSQQKQDENWLLDQLDQWAQSNITPFLLILDGVTDPHNLGACLRSAEAAGVHAVIIPKDRSVGITPVVRKVASGAAEILPVVRVTNLARMLRELADRGIWIVGTADEAADSLYSVDLSGALAVVMGAEGGGMRRLTKEHCSQLVNIPMAGQVSSLNVSVATGVTLFEAVRQRHS